MDSTVQSGPCTPYSIGAGEDIFNIEEYFVVVEDIILKVTILTYTSLHAML